MELGKVIEHRIYHTVHGDWHYFTTDDVIDLEHKNYITIATLESYRKLRDHYGEDRVVPFYITVPDDRRLIRAVKRENNRKRMNTLRCVADTWQMRLISVKRN